MYITYILLHTLHGYGLRWFRDQIVEPCVWLTLSFYALCANPYRFLAYKRVLLTRCICSAVGIHNVR